MSRHQSNHNSSIPCNLSLSALRRCATSKRCTLPAVDSFASVSNCAWRSASMSSSSTACTAQPIRPAANAAIKLASCGSTRQRSSRANLICLVVSNCMGTCCTRERIVGNKEPGSGTVSSKTTSGSGSSSVFNKQLAACTFISCIPRIIKILRRPSNVLRAASACNARTCSIKMNCFSGGLLI